MKLDRARRALFGGILWGTMGIVLIVRGILFGQDAFDDGTWLPWLVGGVVLGTAKGVFVLRKTCKRMLGRIEAMPGREPFWQIYPPRFLFTIPLMIGMGIGARMLFEKSPQVVLGIYVGIGAALFFSSLPFFGAVARLSAEDRALAAEAA